MKIKYTYKGKLHVLPVKTKVVARVIHELQTAKATIVEVS